MKMIATLLVVPMMCLCVNVGCSHEVAHSETTHPNLLGGQTTSQQTTYQNADGSYSTEKSKTSTH